MVHLFLHAALTGSSNRRHTLVLLIYSIFVLPRHCRRPVAADISTCPTFGGPIPVVSSCLFSLLSFPVWFFVNVLLPLQGWPPPPATAPAWLRSHNSSPRLQSPQLSSPFTQTPSHWTALPCNTQLFHILSVQPARALPTPPLRPHFVPSLLVLYPRTGTTGMVRHFSLALPRTQLYFLKAVL